jgi:hypothetical protein
MSSLFHKYSTTTLPNNPLAHHSCSLDLISPEIRKRVCKQVAQRIAQRRMLEQHELAQDGSSAVHRTGIDEHGDYYSSADMIVSYTQVEFLNQNDVVLAGCQDGCIDIVKLPRFQAPNDERTTRIRPMGTLLAKKVTAPNTSARPVQCIKSIHGGKSFVVGHAGEFVVYDTERSDASNSPVLQQRLQDSSQMDLRCQTFSCTGGTRSGDDYFRYITSIESMLKSFGLTRDGALDFNDIYHFPGKPCSAFSNPRFETLWDFRETSGALMACFLEREQNSYSTSVVDGRVSKSTSPTVRHFGKGASNQYDENAGHVASLCFVSDYSLATLHMWHKPSRDKSSTVVKLWDIRSSTARPVTETCVSPTLYDTNGNVIDNVTVDLDNHVTWESSPAQARLISSVEDNGLIMASIVTNNDVAESYLLDTSRARVVNKYRTRSAVQSTNAITPTLDGLACYDSSSLSLYDFSKPTFHSSAKRQSLQGKKRTQDKLSTNTNDELNEECLVGNPFAPVIEDEIGIRARLSCLTFNKTGTSLVGGTDSGDLFLWRGG